MGASVEAVGASVACMEVELVLASLEVEVEHVAALRERSAELAASVAEEVVQALVPCPMWALDREHTCRRRLTSMLDVAATLMQFAPDGISLASSRHVAF